MNDIKPTKILVADGKWYTVKPNSYKYYEMTTHSQGGTLVEDWVSFTTSEGVMHIKLDSVWGYM